MVQHRSRPRRGAGGSGSRPASRHGGAQPADPLHGLREIATGIGILSQDDPTPWIWGRVVGDVLDLGTLATGLRPENRQRANVRLAIAAVAGAMTLDVLCARALATEAEDRRRHPRPDSRLQRPARHGRPAGCDARRCT